LWLFGEKRDEVTGEWKKTTHGGGCSAQHYKCIRVKNSRRVNLGGGPLRAACLEERRVPYMVVMGKLEGNRPLGNLFVNGNNINKEFARNVVNVMDWIDLYENRGRL
jgi:hypothetical protein